MFQTVGVLTPFAMYPCHISVTYILTDSWNDNLLTMKIITLKVLRILSSANNGSN